MRRRESATQMNPFAFLINFFSSVNNPAEKRMLIWLRWPVVWGTHICKTQYAEQENLKEKTLKKGIKERRMIDSNEGIRRTGRK